MAAQFSIWSIIYAIGIVLTISVATVLSFFAKEKNSTNRILACIAACIVCALILSFLLETHLIIYVPHLYKMGYIPAILIAPLCFLYVRNTIFRRGLPNTDIIHLVPLAIFIIDYAPFLVLSADSKREHIVQDNFRLSQILTYDEGWLSKPGFHNIMRYGIFATYWCLQIRLLARWFVRNGRARAKTHTSKKTWLILFVGLQIGGLIPAFVNISELPEKQQWAIYMALTLPPILLCELWLLFKPEILYGIPTSRLEQPPVDRIVDMPTLQHEIDTLMKEGDASDISVMTAVMKQMTDEKKYLLHKYSINDLAYDTDIPPHQLSGYLNGKLKMSFNDFLNHFRVQSCIDRINDGDAERLTLEALAFECGFNNRNSFTNSFKRFTGMTPSEFIRGKEKLT